MTTRTMYMGDDYQIVIDICIQPWTEGGPGSNLSEPMLQLPVPRRVPGLAEFCSRKLNSSES